MTMSSLRSIGAVTFRRSLPGSKYSVLTGMFGFQTESSCCTSRLYGSTLLQKEIVFTVKHLFVTDVQYTIWESMYLYSSLCILHGKAIVLPAHTLHFQSVSSRHKHGKYGYSRNCPFSFVQFTLR